MRFQHNNIEITEKTYTYVSEYKKQLLLNITRLMNNLDIKFVISHGNLIEYQRGSPLFHDDDLDIRFNVDDIDKWEIFCKENDANLNKYNLRFDNRFHDIKRQKYNGIQCWLIKFSNNHNIQEFTEFDIHCDFVANNVEFKFWPDYKVNYLNSRKVKYLDVDTFAPSIEDTHKVLCMEYGENYMIPDKPPAL